MMQYMLDTNICIYISQKNLPQPVATFRSLRQGEVGISVVTYAELLWGAEKSHSAVAARRLVADFIERAPVLPIGEDAGPICAEVRAYLARKGTPIGANDLWIAAHALAENLVLVTNNEREFKRVPGLKIENWTK